MKRFLIFAACLAALPILRAEQIEIVSPGRAYTFAYGGVLLHQLERNNLTNELIARVTFSNCWYAGDHERRVDEEFDFPFPGLQFDRARQSYSVPGRRGKWIEVAQVRPNFPSAKYVLTAHAKILLVNRHGSITTLLHATPEPRDGERWVEINESWSLQNLLTAGLQALTR